MRIGLQTWGSHGDIVPFFALASGLNQAGHQCTLTYTSIEGKDYSELGAQLKVDAMATPLATLPAADPYDLTNSNRSDLQLIALLEVFYEPAYSAMLKAAMKLGSENDLLIGHTLCHSLQTAAEIYKKNRVTITFSPQSIADPARSPIGKSMGPWVNKALWAVGDQWLTHALYRKGQKARKELGLARIKSLARQLWQGELTLVAANRVLIEPSPFWPASVAVTGHFALPAPALAPIDPIISDFLKAGPPPILFALGTCMGYNTTENVGLFEKAAQIVGVRAIIQLPGLEKPQKTNEQLLLTGPIPHDLIMPHCKAVVHHGGAGTLHTTLAAGIPSIIIPHAYDQLFWAEIVTQKKLGISAGPRKKLTAYLLAEAIRKSICDTHLAINCSVAAQKVKGEYGVKNAITHIQKHTSTRGGE